jgi:hypothetical protein
MRAGRGETRGNHGQSPHFGELRDILRGIVDCRLSIAD